MRSLKITAAVIATVFIFRPGSMPAADVANKGASAVEQAILRTQSDIEHDTKTLNGMRSEIAEQRRPLAARLEDLQKTVKECRADVEHIRRIKNQSEKEQAALEEEATAVEDEIRFLSALFAEYARAMETRLGTAESLRIMERLRPVQQALRGENNEHDFADVIANLLAISADSNTDRFGGFLFEGLALEKNGIERKGRFAVFGPVAFFASNDDGPAGLAVTQFGAIQPAVYARFPEDAVQSIRDLVQGGMARVPIDVTGGDAIKMANANPTFMEHLKKGGLVMLPLLAVALAAGVLAIWKTIELSGIRIKLGGEINAVINAAKRGNILAARQAAARARQPLRSLLEEAIAHRESPRDHLEEIMHEHVLAALPRLERNLGILAVLGGIAPLLGLLGTVTGMIHTFQLVTIFGSGDAKLLSGGISEALVTTEAGLAIAIPVLLTHAFLARRAHGIIGALERAAVAIINDLKTRSAAP